MQQDLCDAKDYPKLFSCLATGNDLEIKFDEATRLASIKKIGDAPTHTHTLDKIRVILPLLPTSEGIYSRAGYSKDKENLNWGRPHPPSHTLEKVEIILPVYRYY